MKKFCKALLIILLFSIYCILAVEGGFAQGIPATKNDSVKTIPDTLLFRIQTAQSAITEINAANKKGYALDETSRRIADVRTSIEPLSQSFSAKGELESKSLLSYDLILRDADTKLKSITEVLVKNSNDLQRMSQQVLELSNDSLLKLTSGNEQQKLLYQSQINDIKNRLQDAGKVTGTNLEEVNKLLAATSSLGIVISNLRAQTSERLEQSGKLALSKQNPYLWQAPLRSQSGQPTGNLIVASYRGQQQILKYFINSTWDNRFLAILISIAFFVWVHRNFRAAKRASIKRKIGELSFEYIRPYPVLATLIVLLNITPLFEPDAPSLYVELVALLLLLLMTIHLWHTLEKVQLRFWLVILGLYVLLIAGSAAVDDGFPLRLLLVCINAFFIYLGIQLYRKITFKAFSKKYVRLVIVALIGLNLLSIILNVFGRVDLAKLLSVTGVIGLIQLISLAVFVQIMLDALDLQIKISSCSNGIFSRINHSKSQSKVKKALSVLSVILWVMVFFINLSIINGIWSWLGDILSKPRVFGSIHFSFGNILFFVAIIYVANKLQKHVPLLFGEEKITFSENSGQKGSKVALARLIIIVIGVLLAVMASGLPMDKLTVVLGAFGVGIGLGMQNIVNNFVSGIILIFEKPFRIGDYVELADKKGKVRDIGIRSSRLLTPQGSEVIIPNGDLLSGRLVNWTLSNDYIKTEIVFKVASDTNLDELNKVIDTVLGSADDVVKNLNPEILLNSVSADSMEIKVLAWISNIYVEAEFKNNFFRKLIVAARDAQIKVM
ncbi:mechanosensitive ion channel family protein [Pedobacter sp. BMA]|uniref:mechanosensitive ion channel family protein n=1 Tax=Pedobacter sp. BMA TaxID=1663685 RepID=UPI00064B70C2|nr:mechanosensitive ion channel domain-containing protein [Pedobacter sp. BMA]KLT63763.1 mechanosensitive ion channel protein [Pedobacter sp. BMA]